MPNQSPDDIRSLDSWKEIAVFLKRGVRTVQRWERTEGLPVRRHQHLKRGTVYAVTQELADWQRARQLGVIMRTPAMRTPALRTPALRTPAQRTTTLGGLVDELHHLQHLAVKQAYLTQELREALSIRGRIESFYPSPNRKTKPD